MPIRYEHESRIGCQDLGRRVTVRYRTRDGAATDVVGVLEVCDQAAFGVRNRAGDLVTVERAAVVAAKVVAAGTPRRRKA